MVSAGEKQRLMEQHRRDGLASRAPVLKSAAGIAVIALISLIGIQTDTGRSAYAPDHAEAIVIIARASGAVAEPQKQMAEPRRRFQLDAPSYEVHAAAMRNDASVPAYKGTAVDELTLLRRSSD